MSLCDKQIASACNFSLPAGEQTQVDTCNRVMGEFRNATEKCKLTPTKCECWNSLVKNVTSVKKCNIGKICAKLLYIYLIPYCF